MPPYMTTTTYWFAVETRARGEFAALADINAMPGLEAYLPRETRQRRTFRGKETVYYPVMPGFIFVGSPIRPIADVSSPEHPHPIYNVLKSKSVRGLVRSAGGGAQPMQPLSVHGWRVDFVDYMREREEAGDFDFTPRQKKAAPSKPKTRSLKAKGAWEDQLDAVKKHLEEWRVEAMAA